MLVTREPAAQQQLRLLTGAPDLLRLRITQTAPRVVAVLRHERAVIGGEVRDAPEMVATYVQKFPAGAALPPPTITMGAE